MIRRICCLLLCFIIIGPAVPGMAQSKPELMYFYENYCASCAPEEDFVKTFKDITGKSVGDYQCAFYNVRYENAREAMNKAIASYNIPEEMQFLPLLILDNQVYAGQDAIASQLPSDILKTAGSTESVVYYLYVTACASCVEAKASLDMLPNSVSITQGTYTFESNVEVVSINIGEETALALSLFKSYGVPEDKQVAPIVFLKDRYLSGSDEIKRELSAAVAHGEAVGTPITQLEAKGLPQLQIWGTLTAGLIGGLNPCALSMVLLLVSILIPMKKGVGRYAFLFLISKFVCYLAIGTLFAGVMQALDLNWLPFALKIFLTVYLVVLIVLNVWDAIAAGREAYGKIRNQLPARLRKFLHHRITKINGNSKAMVPAILLLGVVVAASEFLCAGQVYLATLLSVLQSGGQGIKMFYMLVAYCLAFLVPSVLLIMLIIKGKAVFQVSDWMRRHMMGFKLVTAIFFVAILLGVWLL